MSYIDELIAEVRTPENMKSYLSDNGLPLDKPFRCLNPDHTDSTPSMGYDKTKSLNKVHCFSCHATYDLLDLIGLDNNLDVRKNFIDVLRLACDFCRIRIDEDRLREEARGSNNVTPKKEKAPAPKVEYPAKPAKNYSKLISMAASRIEETDYLKSRGISTETARKYGLGYNPELMVGQDETWKAIIIPTGDGTTCVARNIESKSHRDRYHDFGSAELFNVAALKENLDTPLFITEGELDAVSIMEAGGEAAIGLGGADNTDKLIAALKAVKYKEPLLLVLDSDKAGDDATKKLMAQLREMYIPCEDVRELVCGKYKDPNERLMKNPQSLESEISILTCMEFATMRKYLLKNGARNVLSEFVDGITGSADTPPIPTGFEDVDKILDGGLYEGLTIIGAVSSLGKTTFCLQMADQIAAGAGKDVLIFSLEMSRTELVAKSISRETSKLSTLKHNPKLAKSGREISRSSLYTSYSSAECKAISDAEETYYSYADHIFIIEGNGDVTTKKIREAIEKHIQVTGHTPVVIVDYLQIIRPEDIRATDKQATDSTVTALRVMSRDFKTPVITISSLNRSSYDEPVTMQSFKESGGIEYTADVLFGLHFDGVGKPGFDVNAAKRATPRKLVFTVLKNRNGQIGDTVLFDYFAKYNYFRPTKR